MTKDRSRSTSVRWADVASTSKRVESKSGRKDKVEALGELLAQVPTHELGAVVSFLVGELPDGKVGLGPAALRKVEGVHAEDSSLDLSEVRDELKSIAEIQGKGSQKARLAALEALLSRTTADEARLLRRVLIGDLRQGAARGVMSDAIARAFEVPLAGVRRAILLSGSLPEVALAAATGGESKLAAFRIELFRPLQPMLSQPSENAGAAFQELDDPWFEWKLDGARIQVHRRGTECRIYTRALHEVTASLPEIVEHALTLPGDSFILDGEAMALDPEGRPHRFQTTMRRFGRRKDVEALCQEIPITPYYFDCLHAGEDLIDESLQARIHRLHALVPLANRVPARRIPSEAEAQRFYEEALEAGHEGVMAKALGSRYEAGGRGKNWRKIKPSHTLDLVVLAAEWGSGRRRGWLSNLHLGARDGDGFVMLGKTFKGLDDETLKEQTESLSAIKVSEEAGVVTVRPERVIEIAFSDVQSSPQYPAGLALRFARVRGYRPDKKPEEADTVETVRMIFEQGPTQP